MYSVDKGVLCMVSGTMLLKVRRGSLSGERGW